MISPSKIVLTVFVLIVLLRLIFFAPMVESSWQKDTENIYAPPSTLQGPTKISAPIWTLGVVSEKDYDLIVSQVRVIRERSFRAETFMAEVTILLMFLIVVLVISNSVKTKNTGGENGVLE